jgi:sigma-54 dependent transcriptional regulator, acetoin dehydrogenase operon transcriptional activator AcoR
MTQQEKSLLIVSVDKNVNNFLRTIIHNIIGGKVRVYGQSLEEGIAKPLHTDVVMTSGSFLLSRVKELYPENLIVAPKRLITGYNLEKVLMLPRATRVLVVNHPRSATEETIDSLKDLGITHLKYLPYWKGVKPDLSAVTTAISPGMTHLCPKEIRRVIDIGPRIISMYSFLELLLALDLDLSYIENFSIYYHNFLMESSRKLASVLEQSEILRKYQEVILNQFEDGLVSVNETGKIDLVNKSLSRLVNRDIDNVLSSSFNDFLVHFKHKVNLIDESRSKSRSSSIYDYYGKQVVIQKIPVENENKVRHIYTFREISRIQRLEKDVRIRLAQKGHVTKYSFSDIWAVDRAISDLKEKARNFAATEKNMLITGESGTGKELFAHAIHQSSQRCGGPFVAVNFAGIPESLIESELFGYEPGAFTGAKKGGKTGLFEDAHGGTIFLDEIGDTPFSVQSRLLRVLQEKEIMRVGGSGITPIDVRILAGTNRDLHQAMEENRFRRDLFYRLSTLPLEIPPLREHPPDILYILNRYLRDRYGVRKEFSAAVTACLLQHSWPGNVRELINLAEYILISSRESNAVVLEHLPKSLAVSCTDHQKQARTSGINVYEEFLQQLQKSSGAVESIFCLLEILRERRRSIAGRFSLMREMLSRSHPVTEGRMKRYLQVLRSHDLIDVGVTKQGTALTKKGEALLEFLSASRDSPAAPNNHSTSSQ